MEAVRCRLFVERGGDLSGGEMEAGLEGLPRMRHWREGDGVWVARRGGGRREAGGGGEGGADGAGEFALSQGGLAGVGGRWGRWRLRLR